MSLLRVASALITEPMGKRTERQSAAGDPAELRPGRGGASCKPTPGPGRGAGGAGTPVQHVVRLGIPGFMAALSGTPSQGKGGGWSGDMPALSVGGT